MCSVFDAGFIGISRIFPPVIDARWTRDAVTRLPAAVDIETYSGWPGGAQNDGAVGMGRWVVVGIVAMLVAAMLAYDYTRSYSTMANVGPSSYPSTTGAVPASHNVNRARNP
jgi:hypothetical protein